jgi:hypothetical protein
MTLGGWARRESVLLSCLAVGGAVVGLAGPLGAPWLRVVGLIVAALGALARLLIAIRRAGLEDAIERVVLDRRVRVPVAVIAKIDATGIGVDAAAQTILGGARVPDYVARDSDVALRGAVRAALDGSGPWIVVVGGRSKVGKSRALFEALLACDPEAELELVAPVDGEALRSLLTPGQRPQRGAARAVLWLDDLEPFLNQAVTLQTLREWHASNPGIVAATYGGKGSELVAPSSSSALETSASELLSHACEISGSDDRARTGRAARRPVG